MTKTQFWEGQTDFIGGHITDCGLCHVSKQKPTAFPHAG